MLERITKEVIQQCFAHGYISEDDILGCEYNLLCKLEAAFFLLSVFCIGLATHSISKFVVFTVTYRLLRRHSGGFHLSNYWLCYISSLLITSLCILLAHMPVGLAVASIIVSDLLILALAPINHPNYGGSAPEMAHHRWILLLELGIVNLIFLLSLLFHAPSFFPGSIAYAVLCVAILVATAKILRQEV